VRRCCTKRVLE